MGNSYSMNEMVFDRYFGVANKVREWQACKRVRKR